MTRPPLTIDGISRLATVNASSSPADLEAALIIEGFTMGFFGDQDANAPLTDFLEGRRALEPYLKYCDSRSLVTALRLRLPDGGSAKTVAVPRSAAGPDMKTMFLGCKGRFGSIEEAVIRVRRVPEIRLRGAFHFSSFDAALAFLRVEAQRLNRPHVLRLPVPEPDQAESTSQRPLLIFGFEGPAADIPFRFQRARRRALAMLAEAYEPTPGTEPALDPERFPALFPKRGFAEKAEARIHANLAWPRISPFLQELRRLASGIYTVRGNVTQVWHEGAMLSLELLSRDAESAQGMVARMLDNLLELLVTHEAALLEVTPLSDLSGQECSRFFAGPFDELLEGV